MSTFSVVQHFPFPLDAVFDFFRKPANIVAVAPAEMGLRLIEAPEVVEVGARILVEARRWGVTQRLVTEVVELEERCLIVEEQRQGPFRAWRHSRIFRVESTGTEVIEEIEYRAPTGMLGLLLSPARIENDLESAFAQRQERIIALLRQFPGQ